MSVEEKLDQILENQRLLNQNQKNIMNCLAVVTENQRNINKGLDGLLTYNGAAVRTINRVKE